MDMKGHEIQTADRVVHNLPVIVLQAVTTRVCRIGPSNLHLIGPLKEQPAGKQFATDTNVMQAATF
jgi:hypothetical protein